MTNKMHIIGKQHLRYNLKIWNKKYAFNILNDSYENVTLVKLMDTRGKVNHVISIVGYWIFDSNYEKLFFLTKE